MYILVMGSDLAGRAPSLAPLLWAWEKGLGSFHSCSRCCTELMEGLPGSPPRRLFSPSAKKNPFHSPLKTHLIVRLRCIEMPLAPPVSRSSRPPTPASAASCTRVCKPGRAGVPG